MQLSSLLVSLAALPAPASAGFLQPQPPPVLLTVHDATHLHATNRTYACDGSAPNTGVAFFDQRLSHAAGSGGDNIAATFRQKYFWTNATWGGPGYPVVLMTPGEVALAPYCEYLTNRSLAWQMAARVQGALVLIEHRYYGDSSPYPMLTTETLLHLTLENAVHDLAYFARHVRLPFDTNGTSNAPGAPWVLTGGSYGGALSAWTARIVPDTFWAYHASSAPVEAIYDFWQFFEPIRAGMARNCSRDLAAVAAYVDKATTTLGAVALHAFKEKWGLAALRHPVDFASALANVVSTWQDSTLTSGYTEFFKMCDALQGFGVPVPTKSTNSAVAVAGASGRRTTSTTDVATKVDNVAWYFKHKFLPGFCYNNFHYDEYAPQGNMSYPATGCLDTYNTSSPLYTDRAINNSANIQWYWMLCNEPLAYWQTGSTPSGVPALVSRLMNTTYFQRQCGIYFGMNKNKTAVGTAAYGSAAGLTVADTNARTGGWGAATAQRQRMLWVNGQFDPWRPTSMSSTSRPGGPLPSTPDAPVLLVAGGKHCEDLIVRPHNNRTSAYLAGLQARELAYVAGWVDAFYDGAVQAGQNRTAPRFSGGKA